MINKVLISIIFIVLMLTFCGCSNSNNSVNNNESSANNSLLTNNSDEISYAKMLPPIEEIFKNGEIQVLDSDGGNAYILWVTNFTDDEYSEYVEQCKEYGFNDVSYEIKGERFGAYTSDGKYWVQLSKDPQGTISIIAQKAKNK